MQPMNGFQFYLEVIDDDSNKPIDDLIDIIIVDRILEANSEIVTMTATGMYEKVDIDLQLEARCLNGFTGDFCTVRDGLSLTARIGVGVVFSVVLLLLLFLVVLLSVVVFVKHRKKKKLMKRLGSISRRSEQEDHYTTLVCGLK